MAKMHTRMKRKLGLSSHRAHRPLGMRAHRQRTFGTREAAEAWAKANGVAIKELRSVKKGRRLAIVQA